MFPAEPNGWTKREPARGVDPLYVREAPVSLAANTGIPTDGVTGGSDFFEAA
jgi:hypothetical protein